MTYEIRRPMQSSGADRWENAATVSRHRTLSGAERGLRRQQSGARAQGGHSQDEICGRVDGAWTPVTSSDEGEI